MDSFASWKKNVSGMEKEERERERRRHFKEKMSLEEAHHHRRPWIRAWRKKEMNEWRGKEDHEILCSKIALKSEVEYSNDQSSKKGTHMTSIYSLSVTQNWRES